MRLSIEITPEQHQRLKAAAALKGQTIKQYVLSRTLPELDDDPHLRELEAFLEPRVEAARKGARSVRSVRAIFDETQDSND